MRKRFLSGAYYLAFFLIVASNQLFATQDMANYTIGINDIQLELQENWLKIPQSAECTVSWKTYIVSDDNYEPLSIAEFDSFNVQLIDRSDIIQEKSVQDVSEVSFQNLQIGNEYRFIVIGYLSQGNILFSETANIYVGKESVLVAQGPSSFRIEKYNPLRFLSGRIPMALFDRGEVFDSATKPGKMAFHLIWWFFIIGSVIIVVYSVPRLRLGRIFPVTNKLTLEFSLDRMYVKRKNLEFEKILIEWKELSEEGNEFVSQQIKEKNLTCMADIQAVNIEFWKTRGHDKISVLKKRLDDLEDKLLKNSKNLNSKQDTVIKLTKHLPTIQIIRAGLDNHELGGYRWLEVSSEVDRAIENRAASELETLRRKSYIDWFVEFGYPCSIGRSFLVQHQVFLMLLQC